MDFTSFPHPPDLTEYVSFQTNLSKDLETAEHNCVRIVYSEMEFIPWENPENVITEQAETIVYRVKNIMIVLLFLIGGPTNVINMAVFRKQGLGDRVNLCLFALSLADGLFVTLQISLYGEQMYIQFTTQERFGPAYTFSVNNSLLFLIASSYISHVLSAIIATERCLCVLNPLRFQSLLRTRTMAAIIIVISIVITCLCVIIVHRYRVGCFFEPTSGDILITFIEGTFYKQHKRFINIVHGFVLGLGLPVTEMVVVTTATAITVVKLRQAVTWRSGTSSSISAKELALTKILVGNSVFFIVCITPVTVIRFSNLLIPELSSGRRHHNLFLTGVWFTEMFTVMNATFNFFIYFIMGSHYRQTFWALLGRQRTVTNMRTTKL